MIEIKSFQDKDFNQVREIYQLGIDTGNATFETTARDKENWEQKFIKDLRLVALREKNVAGWVALASVSNRLVYSGVCEVSLYIHPLFFGQGIGRKLLQEIIVLSETKNIWTLQAGIFPENTASINLHKSLGFREVGYREKIGKRDDAWRNTILLERRSKIVGI